MNRIFIVLLWMITACQSERPVALTQPDFYVGADLSYVNQILDHGGIYKETGEVKSPYAIFSDHGTNLVRLRLWHNPAWTKGVYGPQGTQLYNDLHDVTKAIALSKQHGMKVLLDFHFSDMWADPGRQEIPKAWEDITELDVLSDSVYRYTKRTLESLEAKGLMPEFVQVGNETNCGMMYSNAKSSFPKLNGCEGHWSNLGEVYKSAIRAIREVSETSTVKTKIIIHVADPKNVEYYFDNLTATGKVSDFDIVGFSYYPIWHTTVGLDDVSESVKTFRTKYNKDIMILETAYPWSSGQDDNYHNLWGAETPIAGYPYTVEGQTKMMQKIASELREGGGIGMIYWEPAWISSDTKDLWGQGSSWENNTFFDFDGNVLSSIDYFKTISK